MADVDSEVDESDDEQINTAEYRELSSNELVQVSTVLLAEFDIDKGSSVTCCKTWNGSDVDDYSAEVSKHVSLCDWHSTFVT